MWLVPIVVGALEPFSTKAPPYPSITHPLQPTKLWSPPKAPLPTNRWWHNLILGTGENGVEPYPYSVQARSDGLAVSLATFGKQATSTYVSEWWFPGLLLSATDRLLSHSLVDYDDVATATLRYDAGSSPTPSPSDNPYIQSLGSKLLFHVGVTFDCQNVQAFIERNGQISEAPQIVDSKKKTPEGYNFSYISSNFAAHDVVRVRFYVVDLGGLQAFIPGPTDSAWSPSFTYQGSNEEASITFPLTRGSPYVTSVYHNLLPKVLADGENAIVTVNGDPTPGGLEGDTFKIELQNKDVKQTWLLYSSVKATFEWSAEGIQAVEGTPRQQDWVIRLACLDPTVGQDLETAEAVLDKYALTAYPVRSSVHFTTQGDYATVELHWAVVGDPTRLLMMGLPHHRDIVRASSGTAELKFNTIIGQMSAFVGSTWAWTEELTTISWDGPSAISSAWASELNASLANEAGKIVAAEGDPYSVGKCAFAVARLALIADQLNQPAIADQVRTTLAAALDLWVSGRNTDALQYDATWGGLVAKNGLNDKGADFGNGYYNDHHYHYGYLIYAAAVLAKGRSDWVSGAWEAVTSWARDIANPSADDPYFTSFRLFDWYVGHSWASGLFEFTDGRNQESTSESVNAWYGVYLWGLVTNNPTIRDTGRILLASEIRAAQKYWQIPSWSDVYPSPFRERGVAGIVWEDKVDAYTWFGSAYVYSLGIQLLPFSPATHLLVPAKWYDEVWPRAKTEAAGGYTTFWKSVVYAIRAISDPKDAWSLILTLNDWNEADVTRTGALYFVASA